MSAPIPLQLGPGLFPFPADWDGDGDVDLLLGRQSGTLVYLEKIAGSFDLSAAVGIAKATSTGPCLQAWSSVVDPFCGHWCCYSESTGDICFKAGDTGWDMCETATAWGVQVNTSLVPVAFDWDHDSDLDLLAADCHGTLHYWRREESHLIKATGAENPFQGIVTPDACIFPEVVDWDGDGDLDLLLGLESGSIDYYENIQGVLQYTTGDLNPFHRMSVDGWAVPCAVDWDGDGDIDLILGISEQILYFERSEHGALVELGRFPNIKVSKASSYSMPRAIDWDDDGDLDLLVVEGATGKINVWLSHFEEALTERSSRANPFSDHKVGPQGVPQAVDWNQDGVKDLLVGQIDGRITYFEAGQDTTLRRITYGSLFFNSFDGLHLGGGPAQQAVDWDRDGDLDLLVGQGDSKLLWFERTSLDQLAPGRPLNLQTLGSQGDLHDFGTGLTPHAVDWDGDGDLDLLLGDSGKVEPLRLQLAGFPFQDWNTEFVERREPQLSINSRTIFESLSGSWILAFCQTGGEWFLFFNDSWTFERNREGKCSGAVAVHSGHLLDRSSVGQTGHWQVFGRYAVQDGFQRPSGARAVEVESDGSVSRPHCDPCNQRAEPQCGTCNPSPSMMMTCARELCSASGFDAGMPAEFRAYPVSECECVDADFGATDRWGAACSDYIPSWCGHGHYDYGGFNSSMCCICGGGLKGDGSGIQHFTMKAECFNLQIWLDDDTAIVAKISPEMAIQGSVRYFERMSNSTTDALVEHPPASNPFGAISVGARPYPFVVDWNRDGLLDLLLGSASDELATISSTGSPARPHCSTQRLHTCTWGNAEQERCARALCRAANYATGIFVSSAWRLCDEGIGRLPVASFFFDIDEDTTSLSLPPAGTIVTAHCFQGGAIRYYQQQANGSLAEKTGLQNPFDHIFSPRAAVAQAVDWDLDGDLEVMVGDNDGTIRYFEQGVPCEHLKPCNYKGLCHPVLGTCQCIAGHILSDCSRCDQNYYTDAGAAASVDTCLPCPGLGSSSGVCASRGTCSDDRTARRERARSNSSVPFVFGNGSCACSEHFYGMDSLGLTSCTKGACPAGHELLTDANSINRCMRCPPGRSKSLSGNQLCGVCPAGRSAEEGATECRECPAGGFQDRDGQDTCASCLPGSYSLNGSVTCTLCSVGSYAEGFGMSECQPCSAGSIAGSVGAARCQDCPTGTRSADDGTQCVWCQIGKYSDLESSSACKNCPSGSWSAALMADFCDLCPAGRSGSGNEACQVCRGGSYSEAPGMSSCTLCGPGRYNSNEESASEDACQACALGRFSNLFGVAQEDKCQACETGATTRNPASTNSTMCIQPARANFTCISGRGCSVNTTGNRLEPDHHMAVASSQAILADGISEPSMNGFHYSWPGDFRPDGGVYRLLWCPGIHAACDTLGNFLFLVGHLMVIGPVSTHFTCVRGNACEGLGPVSGTGLLNTDMVQVQETCGFGRAIPITLENTDGFAVSNEIAADGSMTLGFSVATLPLTIDGVSANPDTYEVCWCAMGRGNSEGCTNEADFFSKVGSLEIQGPRTGHEVICYLGQSCSLTGIVGNGISPGDRLMVLDRCEGRGQPISDVPGGGIAETLDGSQFQFLQLANSEPSQSYLKSVAGIFRLCFCRPSGSQNCSSSVEFRADVGLFTARGPYRDHQPACYVGSACIVMGVRGIGLAFGDEVAVESSANAGLACQRTPPQIFTGNDALGLPTSPAQTDTGSSFQLGDGLLNATPGKYQLCWRPWTASSQVWSLSNLGSFHGGPFGTGLGMLSFTCPMGTFRLITANGATCEQCPLGFYCTGGTQLGNFEDDVKSRCASGSTTLATGSTDSSYCLCDKGLARVESICEYCPAGRYKTQISDNATCPGECPAGTTSSAGARSSDFCVATSPSASNEENLTLAEVFVLEGSLSMPIACLEDDEAGEVERALRQTLSELLNVQESEVQLELRPTHSSMCNQSSTESRRLQSQQLPAAVTYRIRQASQFEVDRASQNINVAEIESEMQRKVGNAVPGLTVAVAAAPSISVQFLNCSEAGFGKAFPLGSRPTSLEECSCSKGFTADGDECVPCGIGLHKSSIGDGDCSLCPLVADSSSTVRLTTLKTAAVGEHICVCPKGYYNAAGNATPPNSCERCGQGYYCTGGNSRELCPTGTTTFGELATDYTDCVCIAGYMPLPHDRRNATHRCVQCIPGFFKVSTGDLDCSQRCRPNSQSLPGAVAGTDCFCRENYYYVNYSETCEACPALGVRCPGGFDPPGSRQHAAPVSVAGYYMTGLALAEECLVEMDGQSVCRAGAMFSNQSEACDGDQTGMLCGACKHLSARDLGDMPCLPCEDDYYDWMNVGSLIIDLVMKACFGIFLGKQAMVSAVRIKKMDAIILRILLQWITTCSVLSSFDLSSLTLYSWSQDKLMAQSVAGESEGGTGEGGTSEEETASLGASATGLTFRFDFPPWFTPIWNSLMAIKGSIPSPKSPQESIECLVQRQVTVTSSGALPPAQLLAPAIWWLVYPVLVVIMVAILSVLLAKLGFPLLLWVTGKAKRKLSRLLLAAGVSAATVAAAVEAIDHERIVEVLEDPAALTTVEGLMEFFGIDVMAEVASAFLVENAGSPILEMLERLLGGESLTETLAKTIENVVTKGLEGLGPFLTMVIKAIDPAKIAQVFSDPLSIPEALFESLQNLGDNAFSGFGAMTDGFGAAAEDGTMQHAADLAGAAGEEEVVVIGKDFNDDYVVFGLFKSTLLRDVLRDAFPLYIVTLYSIWDIVTRRMLGMIQVQTILVTVGQNAFGLEQQVLQGRWLYDMRLQVLKGDHFFVGLIGLLGMGVWSVGFLAVLYLKLHKQSNNLQEKHMLRNYGYFYNGLEPDTFWWEILVKKCDILLLYFVTYTELFHDPRAKLIMYLGFAGVFWAAHNMYHPFDDRQNQLADRLEAQGLCTRFLTLFVLQLLLLLNANIHVNAILAVFLLVINGWFIFESCFLLLIEIPGGGGMSDNSEKAHDAVADKAKQIKLAGGGSNPMYTVAMSAVNLALRACIKPLLKQLLKLGAKIGQAKEHIASTVPRVQWRGPGHDLVVITHEYATKRPWYKRLFATFLSFLYKYGDSEQKAFISLLLGQFLDHVLTNLECHMLPGCVLDIFFLLPHAISEETGVEVVGNEEFHVRVGKRIRAMLSKAPRKVSYLRPQDHDGLSHSLTSHELLCTRSTFVHTEIPAYASNGEDLNTGLLFLHRLSATESREFIVAACPQDEDQVEQEEIFPEGEETAPEGEGKLPEEGASPACVLPVQSPTVQSVSI